MIWFCSRGVTRKNHVGGGGGEEVNFSKFCGTSRQFTTIFQFFCTAIAHINTLEPLCPSSRREGALTFAEDGVTSEKSATVKCDFPTSD